MALALEDQVERRRRAVQLLQDELLVEAMESLRKRIMEEFAQSASDDQAKVMHLKRLHTASVAVERYLRRIIEDGDIAAKTLELEEKQKSRFGRIVDSFRQG